MSTVPGEKNREFAQQRPPEIILDNLTISILPFEQIVGRGMPTGVGCITAMDISGDYIPAIWNDDEIDLTIDARGEDVCNELSYLILHIVGLLKISLPNGRKACEPLCDGSASPMRGAERNGPPRCSVAC